MLEWIVTTRESGSKLLVFLTQRLEGKYSARAIKRMVEHNHCQINERIERFASAPVGTGDHVCLHLEQASQSSSRLEESQRILYEDEALLIYNKPAGINCDEKGILHLLKERTPTLQLVHRLDRDTTGALILAKQSLIFEKLVNLFKRLSVYKRYLAIVEGCLTQTQGIIENYLGKKQAYAGQTMWGAVPSSRGLYACTEWQLLKKGQTASLLACIPKTGRTHQIRVHLAEKGHPILGDFQYGKQFKCPYHPGRYLLHAKEICFQHPLTGVLVCATASLPEDFQIAQQKLFKG